VNDILKKLFPLRERGEKKKRYSAKRTPDRGGDEAFEKKGGPLGSLEKSRDQDGVSAKEKKRKNRTLD